MARFALNAVGTDRPGIVAAIAEVLASLGCNLEDSRMAMLHGQFAVMLILEASDSRTGEEIEQSLAEVARNFDLLVAVRPLAEELRSAEFAELVAVAVHGADHPGIVARIAREIASLDGDVIDLATHVVGGDDGEATYVMSLSVALPLGLAFDALEVALERASEELGVRCTLSPGDPGLL